MCSAVLSRRAVSKIAARLSAQMRGTATDRWGADGKGEATRRTVSAPARGTNFCSALHHCSRSVEQLDVETVVKASQALSSEMVLPKLIEKLMRIAMENAGAERGLLILIRDGEPRIEAEATTGPGRIEVAVRQAAVTPSDLPQSALHYVIRTQESVLLDDASADNVYSKDEYVRQKRSKSVLCLPIVKQTKLVGALYLENNLTPCVFTPDRVTVLQLLASQAAISLENAALYTDLQLQVGLLQHLPVSAWTLKPDGTPDFVNQVWLEFSGQTLDFVRSHPEAWMTAVHPEDREDGSRRPFGRECARDRVLRSKPGLSALRTGPIAGISSKPWSCAMPKEKSSNSSVRRPTSTTRSVPKRRYAKRRAISHASTG